MNETTYEVNFIWYHSLGTDRTFHLDPESNIRPSLIEFLRSLHLRKSSIISFDKTCAAQVLNDHPELQQGYDQRRKELLANPRSGGFPHVVFANHLIQEAVDDHIKAQTAILTPIKKGLSDLRFELVSGEAEKFLKGEKESWFIDFPGLEKDICEQAGFYTSLVSLVEDTSVGFSQNLGIFLPQINEIDQDTLNEIDWHVWIGRACMNQYNHMQYVDLETCLWNDWELKPKNLVLPKVAHGKKITPGKRVYVALGPIPQKLKFVSIELDQPDYEEGTISWYVSSVRSAASQLFFKKMGW